MAFVSIPSPLVQLSRIRFFSACSAALAYILLVSRVSLLLFIICPRCHTRIRFSEPRLTRHVVQPRPRRVVVRAHDALSGLGASDVPTCLVYRLLD